MNVRCIIRVKTLDTHELACESYVWRRNWELARAFAQRQIQHYAGQGFLVDYLLTDNITTIRETAEEMLARA